MDTEKSACLTWQSCEMDYLFSITLSRESFLIHFEMSSFGTFLKVDFIGVSSFII
jgi:hypothetical protein